MFIDYDLEFKPDAARGAAVQKTEPAPSKGKNTRAKVMSKAEKSSSKTSEQLGAGQKIAADLAARLEPVIKFGGPLRSHTKDIYRVAFSPDSRLLASGGDDGQVVVWDMATGRDIAHLKREERVRSVIFAPRGFALGPVLISGRTGWGGEVTLQNLNDNGSLAFPIRAVWTCVSVALDRTGRFLAASDDKTLKIWDLETQIDVRREGDKVLPVFLEFHAPPALPDQILWIAFHPSANKRQLAVGCRNGDVRLFQIARLLPNGVQPDKVQIVGHQRAVNCVKYNHTGSLLATAGEDGTIQLWDATGKQVRLIGPFRRPVNGLAFSPTGNLLAAAHGDNTVRIWETQNWEERKTLADHTGPVMGVEFSPDGRYLASCSQDFMVIVYDLRPNVQAGRKKGRAR